MKHYRIAFTQTLEGKESDQWYFNCEADDTEHAIEQLEDHLKSEKEKLIFAEVIKKES